MNQGGVELARFDQAGVLQEESAPGKLGQQYSEEQARIVTDEDDAALGAVLSAESRCRAHVELAPLSPELAVFMKKFPRSRKAVVLAVLVRRVMWIIALVLVSHTLFLCLENFLGAKHALTVAVQALNFVPLALLAVPAYLSLEHRVVYNFLLRRPRARTFGLMCRLRECLPITLCQVSYTFLAL